MATKADTTTGVPTDAGMTVDQSAAIALQGTIAGLNPNDPEAGKKILEAYANFARVTGRQKLLDNINDVLKKAQDGKIDLRNKFANIAPQIIQAAATKELEIEGGNYDKFFSTLYGQQAKRGDAAQALASEGMSGITGGFKFIGWIGAVLSVIPGMENVGRDLIDAAKQGSLEVARSLPDTAGTIVARSRESIDLNPHAMSNKGVASFLDNSLSMLNPIIVAQEAQGAAATRDADTTTAPTTGNKARKAFSGTSTLQAPATKPEICSTAIGAGMDICKAPTRKPSPMGTQTK